MGIQGLIPFLEKSSRRVNVSEYKGCCVAIDAYCWLHKGTYSCVEKLARGEKCDAYVQYCMKFVNMLLSHNIKPILVFDGRHLPAKAGTEKKRRESREINRKKAAELLRAGRVDEARNHLRRCIDVTHEMALALMRECRSKNVDCIVAPYEADAQLAYLNIKNIAQIVITEDSDLVLFGCSKILFKMDVAGNGLLVEKERLCLAMNMRPEQFTFDKFRYMCILSGCDYLPSLPGIGLGKACKFISRTLDDDIYKALVRMPTNLNMKGLVVTETYRDMFMKADAAFRYQLVFDPKKRSLVHLNEPDDEENVGDYVGKMLPPETAYQLALGNLDPFTLEKVDNFNPDTDLAEGVVAAQSSIWVKGGGYKLAVKVSRPAPMFEMHRPSTKGKIVELSSNCLLTPKKRILEVAEDKEEYSEAELESLYSTKKQCLEETAEKENSPQKSPNTASEATSPVLLAGKKTQKNPFLKQLQAKEPDMKSDAPKRKPGALSKFCQAKRTQIDKSVIVQSRFFSRNSSIEKKETESTTEMDSDSKPQTVLDSLAEKPQDKVPTFTSPLQSFKWRRELVSGEQETVTLTAAAKRDFKLPIKKTETVNVTSPTIPQENGNTHEDEEEVLSLDSGIEMAPKEETETVQEECKVTSISEAGSVAAEEEHKITSVSQINKEKSRVSASPKMCRRPGLSKTKKQLNLLDMFGLQKKPKLQHV